MTTTSTGTGQYVASENHAAVLGYYSPPANTKRAMLVHGGRGGTALAGIPALPGVGSILAETGVPVLSADYVDGKQWGNDTNQSRISSLWTLAQSNFGAKSDKVALFGSSMGGLSVLNWARANPTKVACILGTIPAVDLRYLHDNNPTLATLGFNCTTEIESVYGGTAAYNAAATAHNPAENAASYAGIPMLFFYSGNDPVLPASLITTFATGVGSSCTVVNMGNYGHAAPALPDSVALSVVNRAVAFVAQYT